MAYKSFNPDVTYLVTGAAGFIGFHLAKLLLDNSAVVVGVDNMNDYYDVSLKNSRLEILKHYTNFIFYKEDLIDYASMKKIFNNHSPRIVIHLAAQAGVRYSLSCPNAYVESNLAGFVNILELCRHNSVRHLLYASSSSVYGANKKTPFSETDRTDAPISLYAATKKSNEMMAYTYSHLFNIPVTGMRFFTVYGPYGRPDMAAFIFLNKLFQGEPIDLYNNGDMMRDFTYVDDCVNAVKALIENSSAIIQQSSPACTVYNIGHNNPENLKDFVSILEGYAGKNAIINLKPIQMGDVPVTYADIGKLIHDTGYRPQVSLEAGLKNFVEWYRAYYYQST